jgi:O-antigen ligase
MMQLVAYLLVFAMLTNLASALGNLPLGIVSVGLLGALTLLDASRKGLYLARANLPAILFLLFFLIIGVSHLDLVLTGGYRALGLYGLMFFIVLLFPATFAEGNQVRRLLWAVYAVLLLEAMVDVFLFAGTAAVTDGVARSSGFNMQPNLLGALYGTSLPLMLYLFSGMKWGLGRVLMGFGLFVIVYASYLTGSRSGFVVASLGAGLYTLYRRDFMTLVMGGLGVAYAFYLGPEGLFTRFSQVDTDKGLRFSLLERGLELIKESPLLGHGLGEAAQRTADLADKDFTLGFHNTYITIAAELGIPMLLLFLAAVTSCGIALLRKARKGSRLAGFALISLITVLASGMTNHFIWLAFPVAMPFVINSILSDGSWMDEADLQA